MENAFPVHTSTIYIHTYIVHECYIKLIWVGVLRFNMKPGDFFLM